MKVTQEEIELKNGYSEIKIKNRKGDVVGVTKIDTSDVERVINKFVVFMNNGYVCIKHDSRNIGLHRYLTKAEYGEEVDHINGDRADNRKENLRRCTRSQNFMNKCKQRNNKSGFRGVMWYNYRGVNKWMAYITVNRKRKHLGYFDDIEDAIKARVEAEKIYHGEYRTNDTRWEVTYWDKGM